MSNSLDQTSKSPWQNLGWLQDRKRPQVINPRRRAALIMFFALQVANLIFLQKFVAPFDLHTIGIPVDIGPVEIVLPISYILSFGLLIYARPSIDLNRLILLVTFSITVLISIFLQRNTYSTNSVLLVFAIYIPFVVYFEVHRSTFKRMMGVYLNFMALIGGVVLLQHISQLIWSWKVWPNLDLIFNPNLMFQGYVYIQPIIYGSHLMKPNGVFFLEVSYVSQFLAVAFALELVYFQRLWRLIFYAAILVSTFAGTGLLLLAICAPILLGKINARTLGGVLIVIAVSVMLAVQINWYQQVEHRFGEYRNTGASANHRFIEPYDVLVEVVKRPYAAYTGSGPGSGAKDGQAFWWVSTKLAYEYGFLTMISFLAFFGYVLFANAPSRRIAFVLFILFNFMGGFIIPVYPLFIFLLGGTFRVRSGEIA